MRDDAREHARYRPTAFPVTILPWIEPNWRDNHRLVAVAQGGTFAAGFNGYREGVERWRDIVQVCAGVGVTAGLSRDGWVLVAWNETDATYGFGMGAATAISVCRSEDRDNYGYNEYGREKHDQAVLWLDAHGHATSTSHGDFDWLRWDG